VGRELSFAKEAGEDVLKIQRKGLGEADPRRADRMDQGEGTWLSPRRKFEMGWSVQSISPK